MPDLIRER